MREPVKEPTACHALNILSPEPRGGRSYWLRAARFELSLPPLAKFRQSMSVKRIAPGRAPKRLATREMRGATE